METPVCTHKESLYKMGRGKVWTSEENLHLAEAWLEVSEDVGAPEVKGTNQDASEFWQRVENVFKAKAPSPNPSGQYNERAVSAIRNQWTEKVARKCRKFNGCLLRIFKAQPTGCSEQNI